MTDEELELALDRLQGEMEQWNAPVLTNFEQTGRGPYQVLVSCLISLRTKDEVTGPAARRLLEAGQTPQEIAQLEEEEIARLIYPAGFYRQKASQIKEISKRLEEEFGGEVPATMEELLSFRGVGRKTANLVLSKGFGLPAICVDTHVHRIFNRWNYVQTGSPDATEQALRQKLPPQHWTMINTLLVAFGQTICLPRSPWCSRCSIEELCPQRGVERSR